MSGSMYIPPDDDDDPKKMKRLKILREQEEFIPCKTLTDVQKLKIDRMMKHPERPISIPERPKARGLSKAPEFVREVMGSSAAAGSGEFHVYRAIRRREMRRNQFNEQMTAEEKKVAEFEQKIEQNNLESDLKTAKKREKRLKQKAKKKVGTQSKKESETLEKKVDFDKIINDSTNDPNAFFAINSEDVDAEVAPVHSAASPCPKMTKLADLGTSSGNSQKPDSTANTELS